MLGRTLRALLENYSTVNNMTILTESRVAIGGKRKDDKDYSAFIYDYHKNEIVAKYKSDPECKLIFQRTSSEKAFAYYHKDLSDAEKYWCAP